MPVPPQLLLSHPEVKLPVPSVGVVTPCAAEPRFYQHRGAVGPTGVRAPAAGGRQAPLPRSGGLGLCHSNSCRSSSLSEDRGGSR